MVREAASYFSLIGRLLIGFAALLLAGDPALSASPEDEAKAADLFKFVPFVEWPHTAFSSPDSPINICVYGKEPFGQAIDRAATGQRIEGRAFVVRRVAELNVNSGCHIVYFETVADPTAAQSPHVLRGQPVLTISDSPVNPGDQGIINFVVDDNKIRFEIDEHAAEENHLAISSKLLMLAYQKAK